MSRLLLEVFPIYFCQNNPFVASLFKYTGIRVTMNGETNIPVVYIHAYNFSFISLTSQFSFYLSLFSIIASIIGSFILSLLFLSLSLFFPPIHSKNGLTSLYNNELFIRWRDISPQNENKCSEAAHVQEPTKSWENSPKKDSKNATFWWETVIRKRKVKFKSLRPNVESFVVDGEHTQQNLLHGPFRSIVTKNVLVISQVTGQRVVLHQLVLHLLPQPPPFSFPSATRPFVLHQIRLFTSHPLSIPQPKRQLT